MNFKEFQIASSRTCAELGEKLNKAHMIMGLVSELSELDSANFHDDKVNIGEELTDILWFLANYCRMHDIDFGELGKICEHRAFCGDFNDDFKELTLAISKLTDLEKKYIAYNKRVDADERLWHCVDILTALNATYKEFNIDISKCMDNNIAKLKVRFPEKFTEDCAINRDLKQERLELEK